MDSQEIEPTEQSEVQSEAPEEQETATKKEQSELNYVKEKAQREVDAFLADPRYENKKKILEKKIAEIKERPVSDINQTKIDILTAASLSLEPNIPVKESVADESIVEPTAVEEPEEGNEELSEAEKNELHFDPQEVIRKMNRNHELAEDLRSLTARMKSIIDNSTRGIWIRPLDQFKDEVINKLNNRLVNIMDESSKLKNVVAHVESNNPAADKVMNEINTELHHNWSSVENILQDATDIINRLGRRINESSRDDMDRDHPVYRIGSALRQANEEFGSRKNSL